MFFIPTAKCSSGDGFLKNRKLSFFNWKRDFKRRDLFEMIISTFDIFLEMISQ